METRRGGFSLVSGVGVSLQNTSPAAALLGCADTKCRRSPLRPEVDHEAMASRFGNPLQCADGRLRSAAFKPGNVALIGFQALGQLGLREIGGRPGAQDRGGDRIAARRASRRCHRPPRGLFRRGLGGGFRALRGRCLRAGAPGLDALERGFELGNIGCGENRRGDPGAAGLISFVISKGRFGKLGKPDLGRWGALYKPALMPQPRAAANGG